MAFPWSRTAILAPMLGAACSLAIDTDRKFASNVTEADSGAGGDTSDTSTTETMPACVTGTKECTDAALRECIGGQWQYQACADPKPVCFGNACVECEPEERECRTQNTPYYCDNGTKRDESECPSPSPFCVKGECRECLPRTARCTTDTQLQTCDDEGYWQNAPPCRDTKQCVKGIAGRNAGCVDNDPPVVSIDAPANETTFSIEGTVTNVSINLQGHATDVDNLTGTLENRSGEILWWVIPNDNVMSKTYAGSGAHVIGVPLDATKACKPGGVIYFLVAEVKDPAGATGSASVQVTITKTPICPAQ